MLLDDSGEDFHAVAFGAGVSHNDDGAGDPQLSTISGEFGLSPLRDLAGEDEFAMFQIFLNMTGSSEIEADAVYQVIGGTADADVRGVGNMDTATFPLNGFSGSPALIVSQVGL